MTNVLEAVARELSPDAKREGDSWRARCRKCGGHNLVLSAGDRLPVIGKCMSRNCVDVQMDINKVLKRLGLLGKKPEVENDEDDDGDTFPKAHSILRAARRSEAGKPQKPNQYLEGRGITFVPEHLMILPASDSKRLIHKSFPAMVAAITDGKGLIGAQVTWLTRDLDSKCSMDRPRRIYGAAKGGYVRLAEPDPDRLLVVGEGIETTLSAMALADAPGLAALSTSGIAALAAPPCSKIIIAADNDSSKAGLNAANELARRLRFEGRTVRIALSPEVDTDWNDVLLKHGVEKAQAIWRQALDDEADDDEADQPVSAQDEMAFMNITFPKRELMLSPWLPKPGLAMIHAARGDGKTWFALAVGKAVAAKEEFGPWQATNFSRVLYIDGELPGAFLQDRLRKLEPSPPRNVQHPVSR